ncbi:MAG: YdcF family protein [bacterium]|nr:YdcF family protein [bacterium]
MSIIKSILSSPLVWIICLLVISIVVLKSSRKQPRLRIGWYILVISSALLFIFSLPAFSSFLIFTLENQIAPATIEKIENLDAVVVLGGGVQITSGLRLQTEATGATYSRLSQGVDVFKESGAKLLILSGASEEEEEADAAVMKRIAINLGVPEEKIITEPLSRNTAEHALELKRLLPTIDVQQVGVVTSALHMPRTMKIFKEQLTGTNITFIPVSFTYTSGLTLKKFIPSESALSSTTAAFHEWIGMLWYYLRY